MPVSGAVRKYAQWHGFWGTGENKLPLALGLRGQKAIQGARSLLPVQEKIHNPSATRATTMTTLNRLYKLLESAGLVLRL